MPKIAKQTTLPVLKSNIECAAAFLKTLPVKEQANIHLSSFLQTALFYLAHYETFTLDDFLADAALKSKEVPSAEIIRIFGLWSNQMEKWGRLKKVETFVYDSTVYEVI